LTPMRMIVRILVVVLFVQFAFDGGGATAGTYGEHMRKMLASETAEVKFRPDLELELLRLVNTYRTGKDRPQLGNARSLRDAARAQAMDLALHSAMGHKSSTGLGFDSRMRSLKNGALFLPAMGENAARERSKGPANSAKAAKLVRQWIGSSSHRNTMVSSSYTLLATGVVQKGDQLYAVQIFTGPEVETNVGRASSKASGVY
jgi:uncharacterized protein YkwD